jgi:hypothetical protein
MHVHLKNLNDDCSFISESFLSQIVRVTSNSLFRSRSRTNLLVGDLHELIGDRFGTRDNYNRFRVNWPHFTPAKLIPATD